MSKDKKLTKDGLLFYKHLYNNVSINNNDLSNEDGKNMYIKIAKCFVDFKQKQYPSIVPLDKIKGK